jgi:hypothetical protein
MKRKRAKRSSVQQALLDPRMTQMARSARTLITSLAAALALFFGWLQFREIEFGPIVEDVSAKIVFKGAMALYYACWVAGTTWDTDDQELLYSVAPREGKLPWNGIATAVILATVFGVLCWIPSDRIFAVVLALFLAVNVLSWRYLVTRITRKAIRDAMMVHMKNKNFCETACLEIWTRYLDAPWQWYRFAAGAVVIGMLNLVIFTGLAGFISHKSSHLSTDLLTTIGIVLFILVMESWIWIMRVKTRVGIHTVRELTTMYEISPKKASVIE